MTSANCKRHAGTAGAMTAERVFGLQRWLWHFRLTGLGCASLNMPITHYRRQIELR